MIKFWNSGRVKRDPPGSATPTTRDDNTMNRGTIADPRPVCETDAKMFSLKLSDILVNQIVCQFIKNWVKIFLHCGGLGKWTYSAFFFSFWKIFLKPEENFEKTFFFTKTAKKKKKKGIFFKFSKNFITSKISESENRKISSGKPEKEKYWTYS